MAIDDEDLQSAELVEGPELKRTTYGTGLLKGLGITLRHLLSRSVTIHYPDERDPLPPRSRGVIALKTENCTVCMLCARECPDWCIYIEGHKESRQPVVEGKRAKKFNVLDRFAIDYALCMYCGICVEVCPYDALFWSPEYEYAEHDITNLTHEMERLNDWMYTVLPPLPLDEGAKGPELKASAPVAAAPVAATPAAPTVATTPAATTVADAPTTTVADTPAPTVADATPTASAESSAAAAPPQSDVISDSVVDEVASPQVAQSQTPGAQEAIGAGMTDDEAAEIRRKTLEEELAKGSDPRVAEARAKAAEMRAKKGTTGP